MEDEAEVLLASLAMCTQQNAHVTRAEERGQTTVRNTLSGGKQAADTEIERLVLASLPSRERALMAEGGGAGVPQSSSQHGNNTEMT